MRLGCLWNWKQMKLFVRNVVRLARRRLSGRMKAFVVLISVFASCSGVAAMADVDEYLQ